MLTGSPTKRGEGMKKAMLLLGVIVMVALAGRSYAGEVEILVQKQIGRASCRERVLRLV